MPLPPPTAPTICRSGQVAAFSCATTQRSCCSLLEKRMSSSNSVPCQLSGRQSGRASFPPSKHFSSETLVSDPVKRVLKGTVGEIKSFA